MRVEPLRRGAAGIFRDRLGGSAFRRGRAGAGRGGRSHLRHGRRPSAAACGGCASLLTTAEADRGEPLHQRHALLLRMVIRQLAALRPDFVLRRHRQFVDARHARRAATVRSGAGGMKACGAGASA